MAGEAAQVRCQVHVHTATDHAERLHKLAYTGADTPRTVYDSLVRLHEEVGTNLKFVQHVIAKVGEETRVYRTKSGTTFKELFDQHPRSQRG